MNAQLGLRHWKSSGAGTRLVLALAGGSFVSCTAHAQHTVPPAFQPSYTIQQVFAEFADCVRSKNVSCIGRLTSSRGVYLGVDAPLISREAFKRELSSGKNLQCLFWGLGCSHKILTTCALSRVLNGSTLTIEYTKPVLFKNNWQVETTVRDPSRQCKQDFPVIWTLEKGFWRITAIPCI